MTETLPQTHTDSDLIVIGAGPIGLELAAALKRAGLDYLHFDAHQIGYTMTWWPRNTYFFSTTERIEIAGIPAPSTTQARLTGEEYLAYLRSIVEQLDLQVNTYEPVTRIQKTSQGFRLQTRPQTGPRTYTCRKLVIATGDMHGPNCLNIPGEDLPHVSHYFNDPHDYFRKRLLVVGGRNSACEAALRCWRAGARVAISYRREKFDQHSVKDHLLPDLMAQISRGNITFYPNSLPVEILPDRVILQQSLPNHPGVTRTIEHQADFVLLNTGFVADMSLFEQAGVELIGEQRAPLHNPDTMETNVSGLYVAGTAAAGSQKRYTLFIENCHVHVGKIFAHLTGHWPEQIGTIPARTYELAPEEFQAN
jgi:thioredoxin reductase (NADPH)